MKCPRMLISALRGGSGKTILSLGIIAALKNRGHPVAPFKKGPDYIDAGWLALAAGRPCYNLDTFLLDAASVRRSFHTHTAPGDIAVIEGNRGLYDCIDTDGTTSSAELAKLLGAPVILCLDCTKTTRTMAAVVSGCHLFDPEVNICGVVLNRVAGTRHENILRASIEQHCGIPVVGAIPKLRQQRFPERHMGLVPTPEHAWALDAIEAVAEMADTYLDMDAVVGIAKQALMAEIAPEEEAGAVTLAAPSPAVEKPRIGILRDSAFQFYYPENIDAIAAAGADLVFTSPLADAPFPQVDGLYIGGGFPETHAGALAANATYRERIRLLAEQGMPIYAECGGLMYLGGELVLDQGTYPMAGVLPITFGFSRRPQGHGYTVVRVDRPNPFFPEGTEFRGHEFHYSKVLAFAGEDDQFAFDMRRGNGILDGRDGLCRNNVLATYSHLHALGLPQWAPALVRAASGFRQRRAETAFDK
ncbi:MAG: cobyrinate a,c-diamide synthase [Desulfobacterales bacterium]|nr:cobyrinate a,c-diamide synthase [Desulfobacterales bacterium]